MPPLTPYSRSYSFTDYQASNPSAPLPGIQVDSELENVEQSIGGIVNAINDVRRSDGKLKNAIVTIDSLSPQVAAGVGTGALASAEAAAASEHAAAASEAAAASSASAAAGSAGTASDALEDAEIAQAHADAARVAAQTARDFSYQWSSAGSGVTVNDGVNPTGNSAYHWAQVALAAASGAVADGAITTAKLANLAVTTGKIADGAITSAKIAEGTIATGDIADSAITSAKIANGTIATADFADGALSADTAGRAKMADSFIILSKLDATLLAELKWLSKAVGEFYEADDNVAGVDIPPIGTGGSTVWVELTAGLTGSGLFNNGKLSGESISGAAPLVAATAVVSLSGSPMNGQTIRLINSERRHLRPGSAGTLLDDAMQGHWHRFIMSSSGVVGSVPQAAATNTANDGLGTNTQGTQQAVTDGTNGTPRVANETRVKSLGVRYFRRIK